MVDAADRIRNGRIGIDARCGSPLLPAVAALLLAACATYQPAPLDPVASAERFAARRLDSAELRAQVVELLPQAATQPWPPATWNRAELLAAALSLNPKLAVARAQVEAAIAHEITAGQTPNPQLTLQSEYARDEPHPWLYGLSLDLLLRSPARRQLEADLARLETSTARWQLMDSAWAIRRALIAALSDWQAAMQRMTFLDRLAAAQDRLIALERQRVAAGEDTADELLIVNQARIGIEQQQAQARSESAVALAALAASIGVMPSALEGLTFDWTDWGSPPPAPARSQQLGEQALRARSDLGGAIDEYAAAENRLHQAVVRQYPQFQLSPGYYWDHGVAKFPFDVGFTLPLFNRSEGEIAEARAAREVAGQRMLAVQAEIIGAIAAAERGEQVARANVAAAERAYEATRRQRENAALSLRLGGIGASEDAAAELLALRSQLEVAQMRAQLQAARNALEDALHAPLSGPELDFASTLPAAITGAAR